MSPILRPFSTLALALGIALAGPARADTLLQIYEMALQNDPVLKAAEASYNAGREAEALGRSALLPRVGAQASYGESDLSAKAKYSFGNFATDQEVSGEQKEYYLNLEQKIFDLSAWFSFKRGKELGKQAEAQFALDQQDLVIRTVEAYINVLREMDNLKSSKAEEAAYQRQLEQTQQRFEVGLIAITDVHEARAAYDLSVVNRLTDEGNLGVAYEALSVLSGQPHANLWLLSEAFPVQDPEPASREQWVDMALKGNFLVKTAEYAAEAARDASQAAKYEHLPKVTGSITALDTSSDDDIDDNNTGLSYPTYQDRDGSSFTITMSVPLYAGGGISAQRRQAYAQSIAARETYTAVTRDTIQLTRSLHLAVVTDVQRVKARKQAIVSAQSALDATQAGYEVGTRNIVDVLDAQRILFGAIRDYANTRYDFVVRLTRLRKQAGILSPGDVEALNKWLVEPGAATASAAAQTTIPSAP